MDSVHEEGHFTASDVVRDIVIGMSDGLTVPFALAAGLSGAVDSTGIIITAGLAEIAAGSISMGLGGYLAARSEADHFASERKREQLEMVTRLPDEEREIEEIFASYGIAASECRPVVEALKKEPEKMVDFMMKFELGLEEPDEKRALYSALTIAGAYAAGGIIPLFPYLLTLHSEDALFVSVGVTLAALFGFGYGKGRFIGDKPWRSAWQTTLIGGIAAGVAFFLAHLFS